MGAFYVIAWLSLGMISSCVGSSRPNVLFLMMDDLRPNLEILRGDPANGFISTTMHTPNLDALARRSLVLNRAYVQQAICAPSRTSMLTGRRPDTTHVYAFKNYWRNSGGNFTTLPQYFKQNGYTSIGMGKIFHQGKSSNFTNDQISWSEPFFEGVHNHEDTSKSASWRAVPDDLLSDKPLVDEQIADRAVATLRRLAADRTQPDSKPFFLAVGFHKPHLPFVFPKSMLRKYPLKDIKLPENMYAPVDMPDIAWRTNHIFKAYKDLRKLKVDTGINGTIPHSVTKKLRRAYYCAATWADQQLGRVLRELASVGLAGNTIVVFLSDHGYQLGEHDLWTKFTNFETSLHTPMMLHIPRKTETMTKSEQLVEFVDIFPTLVEAAGLDPLPVCPEDSSGIEVCREGASFLRLVNTPELPIKRAAFSQTRRKQAMGYSARTTRFRYTLWVPFRKQTYQPVWRKPIAEELYDHLQDSQENRNVAQKPAYWRVREKMRKLLRGGWRKAVYPETMPYSDRISENTDGGGLLELE